MSTTRHRKNGRARISFAAMTILLAVLAHSAHAGARGSCAGDANNDDVVNVSDLLSVISGWGTCPNPCPPHCPADVNQNCAVNVSDLLIVISAWGPCPGCAPDAFEPNNACSDAAMLVSVGTTSQDNFRTFSNARLHDAADIDVFRFIASETDSSCACCDGGFCTDEDYRLTVTLHVPSGATAPYTFSVGVGVTCAPFGPVNVNPGQSEQIVRLIDGGCPGQDSFTAWVRINSNGSVACTNYTLTYKFEAGCF